MDPFLNKGIADALCTTILLGFASKGAGNIFEYKSADEEKGYRDVQTFFKSLNVPINVGLSTPVNRLPYIVATTGKVPGKADATLLTTEYSNYLNELNKEVNSYVEPPVGAYIGGMSNSSKLFIIGGSNLAFADPFYRKLDDNEISAIGIAYDKSAKSSNLAIQALNNVHNRFPKIVTGLDYTNLNATIIKAYEKGRLFKSYHGMVQAMVLYSRDISNSFIFEIAMGNKTEKVSSCFPCGAFMAANGKPATSIHLGKGDNWDIPANSNRIPQTTWEGKIAEWYKAGKELLKNNANLTRVFKELADNNRESKISAVFLEALTYEGSFTEKVTKTAQLVYQ